MSQMETIPSCYCLYMYPGITKAIWWKVDVSSYFLYSSRCLLHISLPVLLHVSWLCFIYARVTACILALLHASSCYCMYSIITTCIPALLQLSLYCYMYLIVITYILALLHVFYVTTCILLLPHAFWRY